MNKPEGAEDWDELEQIAFSTIRTCLSDEIIPEVSMETTARGLWERLEQTYMGKSFTNKLWTQER